MKIISLAKKIISIFLIGLSMQSISPICFAEPAPVYDADSLQFEGDLSETTDHDLAPPPPPGEGSYIPQQTEGIASTNIDQRMQRLEQRINNMQSSNTSERVESLQTQVQMLRGELEQLSHQLVQLQAQQKDFYTDVDKHLAQQMGNIKLSQANQLQNPINNKLINKKESKIVEKNAENSINNTNVSKSIGPNVAEEQQIYQTAYNFIKAKKYNDAVNALKGMLKKYPTGQFASNAHYWLGELYDLMGKNDLALAEYGTVVSNFPESPRVSDAQLKVGLIYATQSKWKEARLAFKKVIDHYPGTASSRLAAEQLKKIKRAGH